MTQEELKKNFDKASLSICVAGCADLGASRGVPTLPARHYCEKCEVYDFYPEGYKDCLERKPGKKPDEYIEKLIEMDNECYLNLCIETFDFMKKNLFKKNIDSFDMLRLNSDDLILSKREIKFVIRKKRKKYSYYRTKIKRGISKLINFD